MICRFGLPNVSTHDTKYGMSSTVNHKEAFSHYIREASTDGSNRASSYIRAIDLLDDILTRKAADLLDAPSLWTLSSPTKVHQLYEFVLEQQRLGESGIFQGEIQDLRDQLKSILNEALSR